TYVVLRDTHKAPPQPDLLLDEYLEAHPPTARLSIFVSRFGNPIYRRHWPQEDDGDLRRYPLGSRWEPFLAQAVMVLHDRGCLEFDQPLGDWALDLPPTLAAVPVSALLSHT